MTGSIEKARAAAARAARENPPLDLLVLHGSQARGDARDASDWDFAYLAGPDADALAIRLSLVDALGTGSIDLVRLDRASALLRFRATGEGVPLFERTPGAFARVKLEAGLFWCEVEPIVREVREGKRARALARGGTPRVEP